MRELFGFYLPWEYAPGGIEEHLGTRQRASLCDLDYMGEFVIERPDAPKLVQKLFTNDYSKQAIGTIKYTAMCNDEGNMMDDGTVWRLDENKFMYVSGDDADYIPTAGSCNNTASYYTGNSNLEGGTIYGGRSKKEDVIWKNLNQII